MVGIGLQQVYQLTGERLWSDFAGAMKAVNFCADPEQAYGMVATGGWDDPNNRRHRAAVRQHTAHGHTQQQQGRRVRPAGVEQLVHGPVRVARARVARAGGEHPRAAV